MKKRSFFLKSWGLLCIVLLGGILMTTAQTPGIPYQAYILDTSGGYVPGGEIELPLASTTIMLQFEVRNSKGEVEYTEQISAKTDEFGMVSTVIGVGKGKAVFGKFTDIDWDGMPKRLYTDIDFSGAGTNFVDSNVIDIVYIPNPGNSTKGTGSPTATNPENPHAGDVYVDKSTGDIWTFDGNNWINQTNINANNGLTATNDLIQLGGSLIQPTVITSDATNTLAIAGLKDANMPTGNFDIMVVNKTTGVLEKADVSTLNIRQYTTSYTATTRGEDEFKTPRNILELDNIDAYRNGARVDFVQVDANTIRLDLAAIGGCFQGDEIRIVQLQ